MDIFLTLLTNLLPLYALIAMGFTAGRWSGVEVKSLANLGIYVIVPVVSFGFISQLDFKAEYIALPLLFYCVQCVCALAGLKVGRRVYGDKRANLLSMLCSMGNVGYFGLPLVMLLFPPQVVAVYMFMMVSGVLFESTFGYYIAARGQYTVRDSLIKLAKFPNVYALILGLLWNASGAALPEMFLTYWGHFKGAYIVVGMMIIGAALSKLKHLVFSARFTGLALAGKVVLMPLLAFMLVSIDEHITQFYAPEIHRLFMVMALVPFAANISAFAAQLDLNPEKAATTVLIGTVAALIYIPVILFMIVL